MWGWGWGAGGRGLLSTQATQGCTGALVSRGDAGSPGRRLTEASCSGPVAWADLTPLAEPPLPPRPQASTGNFQKPLLPSRAEKV